MGKPSLQFLFRDLTQLGLPKSQFSIIPDETAYNYNPDRYNFYMQMLDDISDPNQTIASKVFGVLARTRRQHERIKEKIDHIADAINYLKTTYTKPGTLGQPRDYGKLAILKDDLNNILKRKPIVSKNYEFDTDFTKVPTSETAIKAVQEKAEDILYEPGTLSKTRLDVLEDMLRGADTKITQLAPSVQPQAGGSDDDKNTEKLKKAIQERQKEFRDQLKIHQDKLKTLKTENEIFTNENIKLRTELKYVTDESDVKKLQQKLDENKKKFNEGTNQITNLEKEVRQFTTNIRNEEENVIDRILDTARDKINEIADVQNKIADTQRNLEQTNKELQQTKTEAQTATGKLRDDLDKKAKDLENNTQKLKEELRTGLETQGKRIEKLENDTETINNLITLLAGNLDHIDKQINELNTKLSQETQNRTGEIGEIKGLIEGYRAEKEQTQKEITELKTQLGSINTILYPKPIFSEGDRGQGMAGGTSDYVGMIENMVDQHGGSWFGEELGKLKTVEKTKFVSDREREEAEDDVLLEYKNNPIYGPDNQNVTYTDRLVFIGVTFVFRAIALFMIDWGINTKIIRGFQTGFFYYFLIYSLLFIIWVLLVNIRKDNIFFGMLFYYINANYDKSVWKRIIIHMGLQLAILPIPLIVTDTSVTSQSENDTFDKRERMLNTLSLFTLIIWTFTSLIALRA